MSNSKPVLGDLHSIPPNAAEGRPEPNAKGVLGRVRRNRVTIAARTVGVGTLQEPEHPEITTVYSLI